MPIGDKKFVENHFLNKFRKVEKSFYSLNSVGCKPNGINYFMIAKLYKKFCQSIFFYGLETNFISKTTLNILNVRQNILVKNVLGFSKYVHTKPLFQSLCIESIHHTYDKYKILFLKQIKKNDLTKRLYEYLTKFYSLAKKIPLESYVHIINKLAEKLNVQLGDCTTKEICVKLSDHYTIANYGLIDSIRFLLSRTGTVENSEDNLRLLKQFLLTAHSVI
jgi:hypothetical protein